MVLYIPCLSYAEEWYIGKQIKNITYEGIDLSQIVDTDNVIKPHIGNNFSSELVYAITNEIADAMRDAGNFDYEIGVSVIPSDDEYSALILHYTFTDIRGMKVENFAFPQKDYDKEINWDETSLQGKLGAMMITEQRIYGESIEFTGLVEKNKVRKPRMFIREDENSTIYYFFGFYRLYDENCFIQVKLKLLDERIFYDMELPADIFDCLDISADEQKYFRENNYFMNGFEGKGTDELGEYTKTTRIFFNKDGEIIQSMRNWYLMLLSAITNY
jgi:hypothetical protein